MAERALPGGELGEHRLGGGRLSQVARVGAFGAGQRVVQGLQLRADLPGRAGEELAELAAQLAAAADPGEQAPAGAAGRAGLPEARIRDRAAGAQRRLAGAGADGGPAGRSASIPPASGRTRGTTADRWSWTPCRGQSAHTRCRIAVFAGDARPRRPAPRPTRVLTRCRRPQRAHSSRLTGSLTRQFGHSGLPPASRVAGSRAAPQRLQGTALALATQLRQLHCPCRRRCRRTTTRRSAGRPAG